MSALDAIGGRALAHPVTGEVIEYDDLAGIKTALAETEDYLRRPEVRRMWNARDALQTRLVELDPIGLPRSSAQTDKQRRVERCPRCKHFLPSEPEPQSGASVLVDTPRLDAEVGASADGTASSGSEQTELLPEGQRTPEQEAALGVDIFGAKLESPEPLPQNHPAAQEAASADAPTAEGEGAPGGVSPSLPLDPVVQQAGEVTFDHPRSRYRGKTIAEVYEIEAEYLDWYLANGLTEKLKAAITTYIAAKEKE